MNADELIAHWKERQEEILRRCLPPELLREFDELAAAIRRTEAVVSGLSSAAAADKRPPRTPPAAAVDADPTSPRTRVPLVERKKELMAFLKSTEPSTRSQILKGTKIPNGTLSILFEDSDFKQVEGKRWTLRDVDGDG